VKYFLSIPIFFLLASCGGNKKEENKTVNKDSLVVPKVESVAGIGRIEPEEGIIGLSSDQTGLIRQLNIKEGDSLRKGQVIMLLDNAVQASQVGEAGRRLETEQAQIAVNNAAIAEAEENLRKAEQDLEKTKRLADNGAETRQKLDDAIADVNNKRIILRNQHANLAVTEKRINELKQQVNTAKSTASKYAVLAPSNGLVLQLDVKPGEVVTAGQSFAEFAPEGRLTALCEIDELFADKITPGLKAEIRYKGYADVVTTGTVIYTAPYLKKKSLFSDQVGEKEDRRVREVRIVLDKQDLLINRQVECVIKLK
jgi:multidrug resistance efflux pump